ncbi:hypothetical protein H8356DRAFT_1437027 [Neocallimastix lanati (nom. inval.)]|nr:hypothetical protein H8356DRAFT_1437027 [Neocallimastix sp. JGI-2020a]
MNTYARNSLRNFNSFWKHDSSTPCFAGDRVDHGNLKRVIDYSYFNSRTKYNIEEESPCSHGRADIIFRNGEIIIIELKVNSTAKEAIKHIHQKKYYNGLKEKGYYGNILLIGINYDQKKVKYSCVIEEYNNNMKLLSTTKSEAERKRSNELKINGENKRLKSSKSGAERKRSNELEINGENKRLKSSSRLYYFKWYPSDLNNLDSKTNNNKFAYIAILDISKKIKTKLLYSCEFQRTNYSFFCDSDDNLWLSFLKWLLKTVETETDVLYCFKNALVKSYRY